LPAAAQPDTWAAVADLVDPPDDAVIWLDGDPPVRHSRYVPALNPDGTPRRPHPPQRAFLALDCEEAFYGGAAGGGKSDALLMAALQHVDVPRYAALILRKTYADLAKPGAIMDRAKDWLAGTDAKWNDNQKTFLFPSAATLSFGYLQTANDKYNYQGAEYQFIGWDELTQFDEDDYLYLKSRLRRPAVGPLSLVPLRMRSAANPGGRGHRWVKRRLILREPRPDDPEDTPDKCELRVFVPAKLGDNPSVDQEAYKRQLAALDPQTRAQLLNGDWNAREPGDWVFPLGLDEVMALGAVYDQQRKAGSMAPPAGDGLILGTDFGTHTHCLLCWPLEAGGLYAVQEVVYEHQQGADVRAVVPAVVRAAQALGHTITQYRFDGSQPVLSTIVFKTLGEQAGHQPFWTSVAFGKWKQPTIDHLKLCVANTRAHVRGEHVDEHGQRIGQPPFLAVSEAGCPILADQLRGWSYTDVDLARIDKHDDHGPDALVAADAPNAAKAQPPRR
jgi:hypothetical protein